jgi:hypothetical protein
LKRRGFQKETLVMIMGWVTLDDGQHVFIGAGGKVLASRSAIKAKDYTGASFTKAAARYTVTNRMAASRERRVEQTTRAIEHAKAAGPVKTTREAGLVPKSEQATKEERLAAIVQRSRAREGVWKSNTPFRGDKLLPSKEEVKAEVARQNREAGTEKAKATRAAKTEPSTANLDQRILDAASKGGHRDIRDIRNELGFKKFDPRNPLANPVHEATKRLVAEGKLEAVHSAMGGSVAVKTVAKPETKTTTGETKEEYARRVRKEMMRSVRGSR